MAAPFTCPVCGPVTGGVPEDKDIFLEWWQWHMDWHNRPMPTVNDVVMRNLFDQWIEHMNEHPPYEIEWDPTRRNSRVLWCNRPLTLAEEMETELQKILQEENSTP